jgi:DNA polymerase/3'-5' exonuclease PolX
MKLKRLYEYFMRKVKSIKKYINELQNIKDGCSQKEIAKIFGFGEQHMGQIKKGNKNMSAKDCVIMADQINEKPEIVIMTMLYEKEKDMDTKNRLKEIIFGMEISSN